MVYWVILVFAVKWNDLEDCGDGVGEVGTSGEEEPSVKVVAVGVERGVG